MRERPILGLSAQIGLVLFTLIIARLVASS
jgi:hypothetical protein